MMNGPTNNFAFNDPTCSDVSKQWEMSFLRIICDSNDDEKNFGAIVGKIPLSKINEIILRPSLTLHDS